MQSLTSIFNQEITIWFDIGWIWFFALWFEDDAKKSDKKRRAQAELSNSEQIAQRVKARNRDFREQELKRFFPALRP